MRWFNQLTLTRQYLIISFVVMLVGLGIIGIWINNQIKMAVTNQTAALSALYVNSALSPYISQLDEYNYLSVENVAGLNDLLQDDTFQEQVVSFKLWQPDGTIVYSPEPELIGQRFEVTGHLNEAFEGEINSEISTLKADENAYEIQFWDRLIETYVPVRSAYGGTVIAVAELYQPVERLEAELLRAQWRSWLVITLIMIAVYLALASIVGRASRIIVNQQNDLRGHVTQLEHLLKKNSQLSAQVQRSAAQTTALNEQYLSRVSAELHDGPAQDLAFALLRFDNLEQSLGQGNDTGELDKIHLAISSAMAELRNISTGLRLPEIEKLPLPEVVKRAIHEYERKTGQNVDLNLERLPYVVPVPIKITLYRVLTESMANSFKHADQPVAQAVHVYVGNGSLNADVRDDGKGFDLAQPYCGRKLGLSGMRERVQAIGGEFKVESALNVGTTVSIKLPLTLPEEDFSYE